MARCNALRFSEGRVELGCRRKTALPGNICNLSVAEQQCLGGVNTLEKYHLLRRQTVTLTENMPETVLAVTDRCGKFGEINVGVEVIKNIVTGAV